MFSSFSETFSSFSVGDIGGAVGSLVVMIFLTATMTEDANTKMAPMTEKKLRGSCMRNT